MANAWFSWLKSDKFIIGLTLFTLILPVHADDQNKIVKPQKALSKKDNKDYFAIVGGDIISLADYTARFQVEVRRRFFHAKVPEAQMKEFRREVGDRLIDRTLLLQEAKRRGLLPDKKVIDDKIVKLEKNRRNDSYWQQNREKILPGLRKEMEYDELIKLLEQQVRNVRQPFKQEVYSYFQRNSDKFTIPERLRVSLIMLKVDPSSSSDVWQAAIAEASDIVKKIRDGADFTEMARIHSGDESSIKGGDMGYIHKGMLAKPAQDVLDMMSPGEISEPVVLLQGVAIFRVDERELAKLNTFDKVKETAAGLLKRERSEQAWKQLLVDLHKKAKIEINDAVY